MGANDLSVMRVNFKDFKGKHMKIAKSANLIGF